MFCHCLSRAFRKSRFWILYVNKTATDTDLILAAVSFSNCISRAKIFQKKKKYPNDMIWHGSLHGTAIELLAQEDDVDIVFWRGAPCFWSKHKSLHSIHSVTIFWGLRCLGLDPGGTSFSIRDLGFWKKMGKKTYAQRTCKTGQFDFLIMKIRKRQGLWLVQSPSCSNWGRWEQKVGFIISHPMLRHGTKHRDCHKIHQDLE